MTEIGQKELTYPMHHIKLSIITANIIIMIILIEMKLLKSSPSIKFPNYKSISNKNNNSQHGKEFIPVDFRLLCQASIQHWTNLILTLLDSWMHLMSWRKKVDQVLHAGSFLHSPIITMYIRLL